MPTLLRVGKLKAVIRKIGSFVGSLPAVFNFRVDVAGNQRIDVSGNTRISS